MNDRWCNAVGVLKPQTLLALESNLSRAGTSLVDGWAASNPEQVRQWEASGELLPLALQAQEQAQQAQDKALADGQTHLSSWEVNDLYGGPSHFLPRKTTS
jgi:hypothetical protein